MHLFDLLDVAADSDLVRGLDVANKWNQAQVSHFLDGPGDATMHHSLKTGLPAIVQFALSIQKLDHEWSVAPVYLVLGDTAHEPLADLVSSQGSINERRWLLHLESLDALLLFDKVIAGKLVLRSDERVLIPVLLLVVPSY